MADFIEDNATTNQLFDGKRAPEASLRKLIMKLLTAAVDFKPFMSGKGSETANHSSLRFSDMLACYY